MNASIAMIGVLPSTKLPHSVQKSNTRAELLERGNVGKIGSPILSSFAKSRFANFLCRKANWRKMFSLFPKSTIFPRKAE